MLTLKECIDASKYSLSEENRDIIAIKLYLSQEGTTEEGFKILNDLLDMKIKNLESYVTKTKSLLSIPLAGYYDVYDLDTARTLDSLTRKMQLNLFDFSKEELSFMKKFELPEEGYFWHDLAELIKFLQNNNYIPDFYSYSIDKRILNSFL